MLPLHVKTIILKYGLIADNVLEEKNKASHDIEQFQKEGYAVTKEATTKNCFTVTLKKTIGAVGD